MGTFIGILIAVFMSAASAYQTYRSFHADPNKNRNKLLTITCLLTVVAGSTYTAYRQSVNALKIDHLGAAMDQSNKDLDKTNGLLSELSTSFQKFVQSLDPSKLTSTQIAQLLRTTSDIARAKANQNPPATPSPQGPSLPPSSLPQNPLRAESMPVNPFVSRDTLHVRISNLLVKLRGSDNITAQRVAIPFKMRSYTEETFANSPAQSEAEQILSSKAEGMKTTLIPEIREVASAAWKELKLTESQRTTESQNLEDMFRDASRPVSHPLKLSEATLNTYRFSALEGYLMNLDNKVSALPR